MSTPAGWYADPDDASQLRYWDGDAWTEHRHDPGAIAAAATPEPEPQPEKVGWSQRQKAHAQARKDKLETKQHDAEQATGEAQAKAAGIDTTGAVFVSVSHDSGRNAALVLFPDRIERAQPKKMGSFSKATQGVEMTPIRTVTSVQSKKAGMVWTKVVVYASGNEIEYNLTHAEAALFVAAIKELMLAPAEPQSVPAFAAPVDHAEQLSKLAALRDAGVLTEEEFAAKKAEILSRM